LRHRRFSKSKIPRREKYISARPLNQARQFRLFKPKPLGRGEIQYQQLDIGKPAKFFTKLSPGCKRYSDVVMRGQVWKHVSYIGESSTRTSTQRIDEQMDHQSKQASALA